MSPEEASKTPTPYRLAHASFIAATAAPLLLLLTEWAHRNPWYALLSIVACYIILAILGFATRLWKELEPRFLKQIADSLEFTIRNMRSSYRNQYLNDIVYLHREFDMKGQTNPGIFALDLDKVFVDVGIAPIAMHEASADMINRLPQQLSKGRHHICEYLNDVKGNAPKLVLLGAPGSGKTTLLKYLALTFAQKPPPEHRLLRTKTIPILIYLREHATPIESQREIRLVDLLSTYLKKNRELDIPPMWFQRVLLSKKALIMFDGLDEIADPKQRMTVVDWVDRQLTRHAGNSFIVTSRPHGYKNNPLSGVTILDVRPFTWSQVSEFLHRWYLATEVRSQGRNDKGVKIDAKHGAKTLLEQLSHAPALAALALNPLLLTMIANVHKYGGSLPGSRVELYADICEVSLGRRQQSKGIESALTPSQNQRVLQALAWNMMVAHQRSIGIKEAALIIADTLRLVAPDMTSAVFLERVEQDSSIILQREPGVFEFAHLTFQEFLAACNVRDEPRYRYHLNAAVGDSWWRECIRLYCAMCNATEIVRSCMLKGAFDSEAVALAIECRAEAEELDPATRWELDALIKGGIEGDQEERRKVIADAILKVRLGKMKKIDEKRYIDDDFITCAEYQLFLDDQLQNTGNVVVPDHWQDVVFKPQDAAQPVSGLHFSHAVDFCSWLTEREGESWRFGLPTAEENARELILIDDLMPWCVKGDSTTPSAICIESVLKMYSPIYKDTISIVRRAIDKKQVENGRISPQRTSYSWLSALGWSGGGAEIDIGRLFSEKEQKDHEVVMRRLDLVSWSELYEGFLSSKIAKACAREFPKVIEGLRWYFNEIASELGLPDIARVESATEKAVGELRVAIDDVTLESEWLGQRDLLVSRDRAWKVQSVLMDAEKKAIDLHAKVSQRVLGDVAERAQILYNVLNECRARYVDIHEISTVAWRHIHEALSRARYVAEYNFEEACRLGAVVADCGFIDPQAYTEWSQVNSNASLLSLYVNESGQRVNGWKRDTKSKKEVCRFMYYCSICHCVLTLILLPRAVLDEEERRPAFRVMEGALKTAIMAGVLYRTVTGRFRPFETLRIIKAEI